MPGGFVQKKEKQMANFMTLSSLNVRTQLIITVFIVHNTIQ